MSLPKTYTRLTYIKSTGTQYIDTGFKPNQDTRLVCKVKSPTNSGSNFLFGGRTSVSENKFSFGSSTNKYYIGYGKNSANVPTSEISNYSGVLFIDANKQNWTIVADSATETITGGTYTSFTSPVNLALFACNTNGTLAYGSATLYFCQIYDNGVLVRDFVPCKNSNGTIGLYDIVNDVFYTNKGSGTFTEGEELTPFYNAVDSTMLDTALTATADAIRAKTGKTDSVAWNESSGFEGAIYAISSGGKIAVGSITLSSATRTLTVSGLNFKPKHVVVRFHYTFTGGTSPTEHTVVSAEYGMRTSLTAYNGQFSSKSLTDGSIYLSSGTLSNGGFSLTLTGTSAPSFYATTYEYIAIG